MAHESFRNRSPRQSRAVPVPDRGMQGQTLSGIIFLSAYCIVLQTLFFCHLPQFFPPAHQTVHERRVQHFPAEGRTLPCFLCRLGLMATNMTRVHKGN